MRVTLKHVAERAGVSAPTVSQILSPTSQRAELFSEDTRRRVRDAADKLGYRANAAARSIAVGRFGAFTLLLSRSGNRSMLPPGLLDGIDEAVVAADLNLMVVRLPDDRLTDEIEMPKLLRELSSDGLLINYNAHIPKRMIDLVGTYRLPSVWINSKHPTNCVFPDDIRAAGDLTNHLLSIGHTRISYVDYTNGPKPRRCHYSTRDRRTGYQQAMEAVGHEPRFITGDGHVDVEDRYDLTRRWLTADDRPSAVVCYTHHESSATLCVCDRLGITVPDDLAIATVHDAPVNYFGIELPTAVLPAVEMGRQAVKMLLDSETTHDPLPVPLDLVLPT